MSKLSKVNNQEWTAKERVNMHLEAIETVRKELADAKEAGQMRAYINAADRLAALEHCLTNEIRQQINNLKVA